MSSQQQIEANRLNAQKSTGPTTTEGRAAVRLNSLKYGLYAETLILPGEDPAAFETLLDRLDAEHQPATPTEEAFVSQIVMATWRRARIQRMEAAFYKNEHKKQIAHDNRGYAALDPIGRLAYIAETDSDRGPTSVLAGFTRYEARMESSIRNATQELRRCRAERRAQAQDNDKKAQAQSQDQTQSAPVGRPKNTSSPKIISIETVERPPVPPIPVTEAPPSAPSAVDPVLQTAK